MVTARMKWWESCCAWVFIFTSRKDWPGTPNTTTVCCLCVLHALTRALSTPVSATSLSPCHFQRCYSVLRLGTPSFACALAHAGASFAIVPVHAGHWHECGVADPGGHHRGVCPATTRRTLSARTAAFSQARHVRSRGEGRGYTSKTKPVGETDTIETQSSRMVRLPPRPLATQE